MTTLLCSANGNIASNSADIPLDVSSEISLLKSVVTNRRIVLAFDLTSISSFTAGILTLRQILANATTSRVYKLTESFVEGEVTWNSRSTGVPWTDAGGTYDSGTYATLTGSSLDNKPVDIDVTSLLTASQINYLIILFPANATQTRFESRAIGSVQLALTVPLDSNGKRGWSGLPGNRLTGLLLP